MRDAKSEYWPKNNSLTATVPPLGGLHDSSILSSESQAEFPTVEPEQDQNFNLLPSSRPQQDEIQERTIRRSMVNRSCIRTSNYSCRNLINIPAQIRGVNAEGLRNVQKIDLSFNSLCGIQELAFEKLSSLKELLLNDNEIADLPYLRINKCKGLRLINLTNNNLTLIPPLDKVAYLQARGNPVRLVTAQLMHLQMEFLTIDWMQYLVEVGSEGDNFKAFTKEYSQFKKDILTKIDFSKQENRSYCDFHCLFAIRLQNCGSNDDRCKNALFSALIARSVLRNDCFFISYLRNFHNQINYASLMYNCRLLLELILETNHMDAQQLFKLRKLNYSDLSTQQVYFESVRLCCQYSNYEFFKYLLSIKQRRKAIQIYSCLSVLIHEILHRYNRQKQSDRILVELMRLYQQIAEKKITVKLPSQYNHRLFKSLSQAALDIYNSQNFKNLFQFVGEADSTTPLHFAMKSRNQQLIRVLLKDNQDVLARCETGSSCKFAPGSTQISRKMIWKRQKQLIKAHWNSIESTEYQNPIITIDELKLQNKKKSVSAMVKAIIPYEDLQSSCLTYRKPQELSSSKLELTSSCVWKKQCYKQELLAHLSAKVSLLSDFTWHKSYRKKIANTDVALFLLHKIGELNQEEEDQTQIFKKLQAWSQLTESLVSIFEAAAKDDLIGFQILHTMEGLTIGGRKRNLSLTTTEKTSSYIIGGTFWCCQNATCD